MFPSNYEAIMDMNEPYKNSWFPTREESQPWPVVVMVLGERGQGKPTGLLDRGRIRWVSCDGLKWFQVTAAENHWQYRFGLKPSNNRVTRKGKWVIFSKPTIDGRTYLIMDNSCYQQALLSRIISPY